MICPKCKAGADVVALARQENDRPDIADALLVKAREHHATCRGCDCQHLVRL